jgi:uncharacterized membrane protein
MKYFIFILLIFSSCQDYNSNSGDKGRYGPIELNESDPNFRTAYFIIQDRCVSCHDHKHDRWAEFKSNAEWVADGLVIAGQPATSELIVRIVNTGNASSSNMPPGGGALPNTEYNALIKWVTEIP